MVSAISALASEPLRSAEIVAVATPAMPEHRLVAFKNVVASALREGVAPAKLMRQQQAMAAALADPMFENYMAAAFFVEMHAQETNPAYHISQDAAKRQIHGILQNRIRDCNGFAASLNNPEFIASATELATHSAPAPKEYDLPATKKQEIIDRLVQPNHPAGAEPEVHVAASALGHRIVHQALANIFRPKAGALRAPLVDALARVWPEATGKELEDTATHWLKARHDPAHSIADGLKETGELYRGAVAAMEAARAPKPAPQVQVTVPATTPEKIQAASISISVGGM